MSRTKEPWIDSQAMLPELLAIVQSLREVDVARSSSVLAVELTELHKRAVDLLGQPEWKTKGGA